ncbi:lamin tail domain-containing protein [Arcanobacterium hippocoleae]
MKKRIAALAALAPLAFVSIEPLAFAAPAGDNVVINEVYVHGVSKGNQFLDYVELFNPTDKDIKLDGWSLQYFSAKGKKGSGNTPLSGVIQAGGYFLVTGQEKGADTSVPGFTALNADATGGFNMSGSNGSIVLFNVAKQQTLQNPVNTADLKTVVDAFGWGTAGIAETKAATKKASSAKSFNRAENGKDTNNNDADFSIAVPSPTNSGKNTAGSTPAADEIKPENPKPASPEPDSPETSTAAVQEAAIKDIQGTGAVSPLVGKKVKTFGIVTAAYPTGGFNGVYIQTPNTQAAIPEASEGLFIYGPKMAQQVQIGDYVQVTGTVKEYAPNKNLADQTITQITDPEWKILDKGDKKLFRLHCSRFQQAIPLVKSLRGCLLKLPATIPSPITMQQTAMVRLVLPQERSR